jgi:hypothetical protein
MVAAYGAVLSTITVVMRRRDTAPLLKVSARAIHAVDGFGRSSPLLLEIRANNIGRIPVHLNTCGYATSRTEHVILRSSDLPLSKPLPASLDSGKSFAWAIDVTKMPDVDVSRSMRLRAWYTDDVGRTFRGRFTRVNLKESASD